MDPRARAGHTLLELALGVALAAVAAVSVGYAAQRGLALYEAQTAGAALDGRAARAINRVAQELFGAMGTSLQPPLETPPGAPAVWSPALAFEHAIGWSGGAPLSGGQLRVEWELVPGELDNGLDDNGDGMIDEGRVVLTRDALGPDPDRIVLVRSVPEYLEGELPNGLDDNGNGLIDERGLCFVRDGDVLTVRLSVQMTGSDGRTLVRTMEDSHALRN